MWLAALCWLAIPGAQETAPTRPLEQQSSQDAATAPAASFDEVLRAQPYFKKILWSTDARYAPFEILIQKQAVPEEGFDVAVADFYGPWLVALAADFEKTVAAPALLAPAADPRPVRLVVLLTEGDYVNYTKTVATWDDYDSAACYDERIRAVVTRWELPGEPTLRRYYVLRRIVTALLHQRTTAALSRQGPVWLREGLGRWLAWHVGKDPKTAFERHGSDPQLLETMMAIARDPARQNRFLAPLSSLATVAGYADLRRRAMDAAKKDGAAFSDEDPWHAAFLAQSTLWVEFLNRENATEHRAAFGAILRAGQRGGGSVADLSTAFGVEDLAALDREFFRWAAARLRDVLHRPFDDAALRTLFQPRPAPGAAPGPASPASPASSANSATPAAPRAPLAERLALPKEDGRLARALALRKAASGDVEGAERDLAAALERAASDADREGLRLESARLAAWRVARDTWLTELSRNKGRLVLERDGKSAAFKVLSYADGVLGLNSAKGDEQVFATALAPAMLAAQMKGTPAGAAEWARAYASILGGDERWEKQLRDKGPEATALRADAARPNGLYEVLAKLGDAGARIAAIASAPEPADAVEARATLDRLTALGATAGDSILVEERREALREVATAAATLIHDAAPPAPEFSATTATVDGDRVELTYDFANPAELADWVQRPLAADDQRFAMQELTIPPAERKFVVKDGAWTGRGAETLEHRTPFEAPLSVEVVLRHGEADRDDVDIGHFIVGICSDPKLGYVAFAEMGESFLEEYSPRRSIMLESSNRDLVALGQPIPMEVVHDGNQTRFVHRKTEEPKLPPTNRKSGGIFLISKTNRFVFLDSVRIRARLNDASRAALRETWIARRVKETGL